MPKVFISYRREDTPGHAGRLYDRLQQEFGADNVFIDVDTLLPGDDFVDAIGQTLNRCDLMIALIGPRWLTATDDQGRPRLDDPGDFVRVEIQTALERRIRTVPVLVERAAMPQDQQLPDALRPLARRQAIELSDTRWASDVGALVEKVKRAVPPDVSERTPVSNTLAHEEPERDAPRRRWGVWSGVGAVVLTALAISGMLFIRSSRDVIKPNGVQAESHTAPPVAVNPVPGTGLKVLKLPVKPCRDDDDDASRCIRACDDGDANSCTSLGRMYATGRGGLTKDETRAVAFYQRGCDGRNERGCTSLGRMYQTGRGGLPRDVARAVTLYRRACDASDALACTNLGEIYANGLGGLPKDEARGVALYQRACNGGNALGCANLGRKYENGLGGLPKDEARGVALYQRACDAGDALGCNNLGTMYANGRGGLTKDEVRAVALFKDACDGGIARGCTNLGRKYAVGQGGLPKDEARAVALYQRACDGGDASGCGSLQQLRRQR